MHWFDKRIARIRRRETSFDDWLYRAAKMCNVIHMPVIPGLHHALYYERKLRLVLWNGFLRIFYYEPLFKSQCESVGQNLCLIDGIPLLMGNPIRLRIGHNVTISGVTTFVGSKMADQPVLEIGNGTYIGYQTQILTGRGVHIGQNVLIANRVFIAADDGHPVDAKERMENRPPHVKDVREIWIEDGAWIGEGATILKGVRIAEAAIVGSQAVVTKDVPAYTVVAGNPARVVKVIE